jgi:hypothetical protein
MEDTYVHGCLKLILSNNEILASALVGVGVWYGYKPCTINNI